MKVMIADDEKKICQLILHLIDWEKMGMEVAAVAHNGVEALEMIGKIRPDIVISDIRMPGCDGLEMIRLAQEKHRDISFIIISGYQQFEYAKRAIQYGVKDYLLKPIRQRELYEVLSNIRQEYAARKRQMSIAEQDRIMMLHKTHKVRAAFFTEVLYRNKAEIQSLSVQEINEEYSFHFADGVFQIIIIKADGIYPGHSGYAYIQEKVSRSIDRGMKECCIECEKYFEDRHFVLLLNYEQGRGKEIRARLNILLNDILLQKDVFEDLRVTIGVGETVDDLHGLERSAKSAVYGVEQRILVGTNRLIDGEYRSLNSVADSTRFHEFNRKFTSALDSFREENIKEALVFLQTTLSCHPDVTGHEIIQMCKEALNLYTITMRRLQMPVEEEGFFEKCCEQIENIGNVNDIFSFLTRKIMISLRHGVEKKKMMEIKPVREAKKYIDENYSRNLTLENVSDQVGLNPSYFSTVFKKEMSVTFLEYLTHVRMNQARELLRGTSMNVSAVCKEVGYSDVKYFTKRFRETTGLKPNEYRKIYS